VARFQGKRVAQVAKKLIAVPERRPRELVEA